MINDPFFNYNVKIADSAEEIALTEEPALRAGFEPWVGVFSNLLSINFGAVDDDKTRIADITNFEGVDVTLTNVINNNESIVVNAPESLPAGASARLLITAKTEGEDKFNEDIVLVYNDKYYVTINIFGVRLSFWQFNYQEDINISLIWRTHITQSTYSYFENRISVVEDPAALISINVIAKKEESRRLRDILKAASGGAKEFLLPLHEFMQKGEFKAGNTQANVKDWQFTRINNNIAIYNKEEKEWEAVKIEGIDKLDNNLIEIERPSFGSSLFTNPAFVKLESFSEIRESLDLSVFNINFRADKFRLAYKENEYPSFLSTIYNNGAAYPIAILNKELYKQNVTAQRESEIFDTGFAYHSTPLGEPQLEHSVSFLVKNRAELSRMLCFLDAVKGKGGEFFVVQDTAIMRPVKKDGNIVEFEGHKRKASNVFVAYKKFNDDNLYTQRANILNNEIIFSSDFFELAEEIDYLFQIDLVRFSSDIDKLSFNNNIARINKKVITIDNELLI